MEPIETSPGSPLSIVCISDLFWDENWSSEQQIMSRLAGRCRVLYVERPVSILSSLTDVSDASVFRQWVRWLRGGLRQGGRHLMILAPAPVFPLRYNRLVSKINCWLLRRSVLRALRKTGMSAQVLWIYSPDAGDLVGELGETYSLYYCADDWSATGQWWNNSANIREREAALASKVDLVVGTSTKIVERWQPDHQNTMLMTNGADVDSLRMARDPALAIPDDIKELASPRIGYVGRIDSRFDARLYVQLAEKRPDWSFVIVGPVTNTDAAVARLRTMANVRFLGARPRADLPAYLKYFDVCTIPYVLDKLSESIFPLKLFEYLAAGRPVVATAMPELMRYQQYVHVTRSPGDFENAIEKSLHSPLPTASESFLRENSWDAKANVLLETLKHAVAIKTND
jgi:glycosyltransferase involved in cell wall biosynthesis